jgi:hypothetical protein
VGFVLVPLPWTISSLSANGLPVKSDDYLERA